MNGTVGGTVSARIEDKRPQVRLALRAEALRPAGQTESPEMPRFSAVLEGIVEADDSHLRLSLHDENATALTVDARGSLLGAGPEQGGPSSDDRRPRVATAPLEISATGTVELGALDALVDLGEGRVTGRLTSDLVVRLRQPQVEIRGGLELQNGTLENPALGLLLKEGSVRLLASGRRVEISELSASDGAGGTLRGSGHADLGGEAAQTRYRLGATLAGLWVARSDDVRVQTDGDLQLEGDASGARLSGTLKTRSVELRPPRRLPPSVVQLEVIEINGPLTSPGPRTTPHAQSFPVELDVTATIPGRAFFRTVDLESEWEGDLHLTGTPQAPVLAGRLSVVRGSFNALGVPFNLVRGLLRFDERDEVDPDVEILAEARRHDIVAQLSVTGTASAPNVTLSSEPPLPTDEIASHLLFGRDATDLSAAQSVQLAAAVARFTSSTAPDPLGWVRRTLRVDRVSVQSDEERPESTVVSVGKYVGRKVFVSFDQGTTAEATSKARVEVELTRQLNVATEVGTDSESRLGLDWRYRY
jgi:translocation and assembly module TamB